MSRSPGGDARLFLNNCVGCHSGMDPMAQAFAYYTYDEAQGRMVYTGGNVQPKYFNNDTTFAFGFRTPDDAGRTAGAQATTRCSAGMPVAAGFGQRRQVARRGVRRQRRVRHLPGREGVPHRLPARAAGRRRTATRSPSMTSSFRSSGYRLKQAFADAATYCMGS